MLLLSSYVLTYQMNTLTTSFLNMKEIQRLIYLVSHSILSEFIELHASIYAYQCEY